MTPKAQHTFVQLVHTGGLDASWSREACEREVRARFQRTQRRRSHDIETERNTKVHVWALNVEGRMRGAQLQKLEKPGSRFPLEPP